MASDDDSSSEDEGFGQESPPLTVYLKGVLEKYPDGGQTLKELVQNADDAGAKNVIFMYDKTEYGIDTVYSSELKIFQGPALYAYNDAVFTETDWDNIQHPGQSGKKDEPTKVGRFGLGFNSVYHVTDLPSIMSGRRIGFLDPREKCFGKTCKGKSWKLKSKRLNKYGDQIKPFFHEIFKSDSNTIQDGEYPATLFRFPLRRVESELSSTLYNDTRVEQLFTSYEMDAEISLLYLKNVESVSLYVKAGNEEPVLEYQVRIAENDISKIREERDSFLNGCKARTADYQSYVDFHIERYCGSQLKASSRFITVNTLKVSGCSDTLQELINDSDLKLLPLVSLSIPVNDIKEHTGQHKGRVFCFLPLPSTESPGFPIHVNGYFGLNDNRRSIKWPDGDTAHDKQAMWNEKIINEVFSEAYAKLLLHSTQAMDMETPGDIYRCWPCVDTKRHPVWNEGIAALVRRIQDENILYSEIDGGQWMVPRDVMLNTEPDPALCALLHKVLLHKGRPVVRLPEHVLHTLKIGGVDSMTVVNPSHIRDVIRDDMLSWLEDSEKVTLLEYIVSDGKVADLQDIQLLPRRDGKFVSFSKSDPTIYIPTEDMPVSLIPNLDHRFAADSLPMVLRDDIAESCTQLERLNADHMVQLLHEALPRIWVKGPDATVIWHPGEKGHPTYEWLSGIWTWLSHNHRIVSLEKLRDIPLLPLQEHDSTSTNHLVRLIPNTIILEKKHSSVVQVDVNLPTNVVPASICSFLKKIGVVVVELDLPDFMRDHPEINSIIQSPTPEGVCEILLAYQKPVSKHIHDLPIEATDVLRVYLSQLTVNTIDLRRDFLIRLPIFPNTTENYVSVSMCCRSSPKDFHGIPVSRIKEPFICVQDDQSKELLRKLGCHEVTEEELLKDFILPQVSSESQCFYDKQQIIQLMTWVLQRSQYDDVVKCLHFIPTASGKKDSPEHLFDPSCQELKILFAQGAVFPTEAYLEEDLLHHIRRAGFRKSTSITAPELLHVALSLAEDEDTTYIRTRATILFKYINNCCHLLEQLVEHRNITKTFSSFLEDIAWVPVVAASQRPHVYPPNLPWFGEGRIVVKPREIAAYTTAVLQGSTMSLVDIIDVSKKMAEVFRWHVELDHNNYVHVERVVSHLRNVAESYHADSNDSDYTTMIAEIYEFLSRADSAIIQSAIEAKMDGVAWIWHGRGFTTTDKVAFDGGGLRVLLDPYLFIIPKTLASYKKFLSFAGVQERFPEDVLCSVLTSIQEANSTENRSQQEIDTDLSLVCDILNCIANKFQSESTSERGAKILVPARNDGNLKCLRLVEAQKCMYVDEERLLDQYPGSDCKLPIVHQKLPTDTARQLGLLRLSLFVAPTEAIDMGYDMEGPHETTVNAIRRNLELYKDGIDIFKELIQNADDAGATQVKFLIDWRTNVDMQLSLMNKDMKYCHGPALWAYNDAQFTESDVKNICNIAAATKKRELDKVGRFGLGFTSVYHLTDVPSVVSGPFIMIFDPRTTHLRERVTSAKPGIKLDLRNAKHKGTVRSFPDQFQPFKDVFGCNVVEGEEYSHTLFRLPLRSASEVIDYTGEILSDVIYQSKEKMQALLHSFKTSASELLLFTQNIENLSVHVLEDGQKPDMTEEILSISVNKKMQLGRSISNKGDLKTERNLLKVAADYLTDLPGQTTDQSSLETIESTMILEVHVKENIAKKSKSTKSKTQYCVSSYMSKGKALEKARSKDGRQFGILPCGGVATKLLSGRDGLEPVGVEGRAFSFLPLEISTGLPFHVNGTFLLQPNRRQLWNRTSTSMALEEEVFEIQWNISLMEDVICKALHNMILDLKAAQEDDITDARCFQTLWPILKSVHSDFRMVAQAFYDAMCGKADWKPPKIIYNGNRWTSLGSVIFMEEIPKIPTVENSIITLLNQHCRPKKIVSFKFPVYESMKDTGVLDHFADNTYTWTRFLESVFFPMLSHEDNDDVMESNHRDVIIQHVLDNRIGSDKALDYDELLRETECIPVSQSHEDLVLPQRLVSPTSQVGKLFRDADMRFPFGSGYIQPERLHSLAEIGMATDSLDWEDICERAETIQCQEDFGISSFQRSVILLGIIDNKLKILRDTESSTIDNITATPEQTSRIRNSLFLPVMCQDETYPLPWYNHGTTFRAAADIYEAKYANLVGCVHGILDEPRLGTDVMTERLKEFLGFKDKEPPIYDIIQQLQKIITKNNEMTNHATVSQICGDIYDFMQKKLCIVNLDDKVQLTDEQYRAQIEQLELMEFLFVDGKFITTKQVAFRFKHLCPPFLYNVPNSLTPYTNLLRLCGVREEFQPPDFLQVMIKLHENYKDNPIEDDQHVTLAHLMLQQVIDTVSRQLQETLHGDLESEDGIMMIHECLAKIIESDNEDESTQLLAVDTSNVLRQTTELTYNDMWWLEDHTLNTTHQDLTLRNARALGIPTARERTLHSCSSSDGFESDFGQAEEITDRLQGILRDYHQASDVMKELLQNADDAKATEIHFVYDSRCHESEKIIDGNKWGAIHKLPALCVYNNRPFSKEDIKGIQKVGVGGKVSDSSTAGRFGIGFNAVYHLTDCPTFITDNTKLCMFDPHVRYVPGATPSKPGKMYEYLDTFREKFPHMLTGYLSDKFNLEGATMFRFPLRSKEMSATSRISKEWYDDDKIKRLMTEFKNIAKESLFFLKYIEDIHISSIGDDGELNESYSISSKIASGDVQSRQDLANHIDRYKDNIDQIPPVTKVYRLDVQDKGGLSEKWLVAQTIGSEEPLQVEDDMQQRGLKSQIPRGGVAALIQSNRSIHSRWHEKRRVYSFLPLPINTTLPVHVNGSFVLDASRRHLAKSSGYYTRGDGSETSLSHPMNLHLVKNVIATAYAHLIEEARKIVPTTHGNLSNNRVNMYYSVFPSGDYGDWNVLKQSTLGYIGKHELEVLPVYIIKQESSISEDSSTTEPSTVTNDSPDDAAMPIVASDGTDEEAFVEWFHPSSKSSGAFFDNLDNYRCTKEIDVIRSCLRSSKFKLVTGPSQLRAQLCQVFVEAGVASECVSPKRVLEHLVMNVDNVSSKTLPVPLEETCFKTLERIMALAQYCCSGSTTHDDFDRAPLRLTNNGHLGLFSRYDPVYVTEYLDLIPEKPELFLHRSLVSIFNTEELMKSEAIREFRVRDLDKCLDHHLPKGWLQNGKHVKWTPGENGHPSEYWMKRLWKFIFAGSDSHTTIQWPIIPTTASTLVLPSKAKTVLYTEQYRTFGVGDILNILTALGCPVVSLEHLGGCYPWSSLVKSLASIEQRGEVLTVLDFILEDSDIELEGQLNENQSRDLLLYFQNGYRDKQYDFGIPRASILKRLPIFRLMDGKLSSIDGYRNCHACNCSVPMDDDVWMTDNSCILLKYDHGLENLYKKLHINLIDEIEIYTMYVLPRFQLLKQDAKEIHMEHIRQQRLLDRQLKKEDAYKQHNLQTQLQSIEWIPDTSGLLQCASHYFDPSVKIFTTMVDPRKLLPYRFVSSPNWHNFLGKLGLNQTVTKDLYLFFVREIATNASGVTQNTERDALCKKSEVLLEEISRITELPDTDRFFLKSLSIVKFIQPRRVGTDLKNILPAYQGRLDGTGKPAFISISEGIPISDRRLAWSEAMVLPSTAVVSNSEIQEQLEMESDKAHVCRIRHITKVCNKMVKWNCCDVEDRVHPDTRKTLKAVMKAILGYLQRKYNEKPMTLELDDISNIPLCLVDEGSVLVCAKQIVVTLSHEYHHCLRPYLYKMHDKLEPCAKILKALGAQSRPTLKQLAFVLASIKSSCGENEMHPNEIATTHTTVRLIFQELLKYESKSALEGNEEVDILYLPTSRGYLKQSKLLCCADRHLKKNIPATLGLDFVVELRLCGIDDDREDPRLIALLPKKLQPHDLGDTMNERPCSSNVLCRAGKDCQFLDFIKRRLVSEELQRVLMRLLRHGNEGTRLRDEQAQGILKVKEAYRIICVKDLKIELARSDGQCLSDQPRERMVFQDMSVTLVTGEKPPVYLNHSDLPVVDCLLYRELAQTILQVCGIKMDAAHFSLLREVIACSNPDRMNEMLTKADIPEYDDDNEEVSDPYAPGKKIPHNLVTLLDINPYNRFRKDEIVAYLIPIRLANVAFDPMDFDINSFEQPEDEYVYARVVKKVKFKESSNSGMTRRYLIDVGRDTHENISATALYKFRRYKLPTEQTPYSATNEQAAEELTPTRGLPVDSEEDVRDWISQAVKDAFTLSGVERKTAFQRLKFMWHPDKNHGQEELANIGFQFLQQEIERLEFPMP